MGYWDSPKSHFDVLTSWYSTSAQVSRSHLIIACFQICPWTWLRWAAILAPAMFRVGSSPLTFCWGARWLAAAATSRFCSISRCKCVQWLFLCGLVFSSRFGTACPKSICNFPLALTFWAFFCLVYTGCWCTSVKAYNNTLNNNSKLKQNGMQVQLILFHNESHNTGSGKIPKNKSCG